MRPEAPETLIGEEDEEVDDGDKERKGFYACYLLVSLSPRHKGHTYIGFVFASLFSLSLFLSFPFPFFYFFFPIFQKRINNF